MSSSVKDTQQPSQPTRSKRLREKHRAAAEEEGQEGNNPSMKRPREEEERDGQRPQRPPDNQQPRWRAHQIAEDYVDLASHMMLYPLSGLGPYGYAVAGERAAGCDGTATTAEQRRQRTPSSSQPSTTAAAYPLQHMSALAFLKSAVRRPAVVETWSPYEIALFEAAIAEHGKDFHRIAREIRSKSTRDVIAFYYIWKKTSHYRRWKQEYTPDYLLEHSDEEEEEK